MDSVVGKWAAVVVVDMLVIVVDGGSVNSFCSIRSLSGGGGGSRGSCLWW